MVLSGKKILERMAALENWEFKNDKLYKKYEFNDFNSAQEFVIKVGGEAEALNHHPLITFSYGFVELLLWTHSEEGLTEKDFDLAEQIDKIS